jgi:hypothetical protein
VLSTIEAKVVRESRLRAAYEITATRAALMDISEVWVLITPAIVAALIWLVFRLGKRIKPKWFRVPARILSFACGILAS